MSSMGMMLVDLHIHAREHKGNISAIEHNRKSMIAALSKKKKPGKQPGILPAKSPLLSPVPLAAAASERQKHAIAAAASEHREAKRTKRQRRRDSPPAEVAENAGKCAGPKGARALAPSRVGVPVVCRKRQLSCPRAFCICPRPTCGSYRKPRPGTDPLALFLSHSRARQNAHTQGKKSPKMSSPAGLRKISSCTRSRLDSPSCGQMMNLSGRASMSQTTVTTTMNTQSGAPA